MRPLPRGRFPQGAAGHSVSGMLRTERHDDVTRLAFTSRAGRLVGYSASAYLVARGSRSILVDTGFARAADALLAAVRAAHGGRAPHEALAE